MLIICQIDWREVGVAFELQCLRNCRLSSWSIFRCRLGLLLFNALVQGESLRNFAKKIETYPSIELNEVYFDIFNR